MIVMLALLNDGAILSIAYDNVLYRNQPEAWNMRTVLTIATVLGLVGPIAAFGLFYLGDRVFHIDRPQLQTMMYLLLSVAGPSDDLPDAHARPLVVHSPGADPVDRGRRHAGRGDADLPVRVPCDAAWWGWAALVWGYALVWFLVTDPVKLLAYRYLDTTNEAAPNGLRSWRSQDLRTGPGRSQPPALPPNPTPHVPPNSPVDTRAAMAAGKTKMKIEFKDFRVRRG